MKHLVPLRAPSAHATKRRRLRACLAACIVFFGAGLVSTGCLPEQPADLPVSLSLRFKANCGAFVTDYDADCLSAVSLIVRDPAGTELARTCTPLGTCEDCSRERLDALSDMVLGQTVATLGPVPLDTPVVFEMQGVHDIGREGDDPCLDPSSRDLLIWAHSDVVTLRSSADTATVLLRAECRDCAGGCRALNSGMCPVAMPTQHCLPALAAPPEQLGCAVRCRTGSASSCFDGALSCTDGTCDVDSAQGGFCSPCQSDLDCLTDDGFFCVVPIGSNDGLCTPTCPPDTCPAGAACRPVGAGTPWRRVNE